MEALSVHPAEDALEDFSWSICNFHIKLGESVDLIFEAMYYGPCSRKCD